MRKQKKRLNLGQVFWYALSFGLMTFQLSCKDELAGVQNVDTMKEEMNASFAAKSFSGDSILLENPYTVENMSKALERIKLNNPKYALGSFKVQPSHVYLKFIPQNAEEEGLLKKDSTTHYFDYRLDAEYNEEYLENRVPDKDSIPVYYTAVPVGKTLPNVKYEVLSKLYIPEQDAYFANIKDNDEYLVNGTVNNTTDLFNNLVYLAYEQTGNEEELLTQNATPEARWIFGKKWRPKGRITINDNCGPRSTGEIGLEGAKILMRQWFTVDSGITDANGYFQTGTVRGKAKYVIQWERYQYSIRSGNFGQAETHGPNVKNQDWNYNIANGNPFLYGHIHRAAYHYYYKNIKNLRRPPENGFLNTQMKIGAFNYADSGGTNGNYSCYRRFLGILPAIRIYNDNRTSCQIYGTTIHELGHASHWKMNRSAYRNTDGGVKESWARGVQGELTKMQYSDYTLYSSYRFSDYTGVVEDLIDNDGHFANNIYNTNEFVNGYTVKQLEDALNGKTTRLSWQNNIISLYSNPTKTQVPAVFNYWFP